jgi:hypothetical protein
MISYRKQRQLRNSLKFSKMGKQSQKVQAERRAEAMQDRIRELAEYEVWNLPKNEGDALGCLQWHDFRTGKVRRWTIRIGDRADRITAESNNKVTKSHGWTWLFNHLRTKIVNG